MGEASVVDYLIGDPTSLDNSISDFSIGNNQHGSNHYPLFFKIGHSIEPRLTTPY